MKKKFQQLTLIGCLLFGITSMQAQSTFFTNEKYPQNGLSIQFGWQWNRAQDLVFSPLVYTGSSFTNLTIQYERYQKRGIHQINLGYNQSDITAAPLITFTDFGQSFTRIPSVLRQIHLHYGYAHLIKNTDTFQWYVGGILETQLHHTSYNFGVSDDDGYLFSNDLQTWLIAFLQLDSKNRIRLNLSLPLLTYATRPKFAIVDNEEIQHDGSGLAFLYQQGEWASLNNYLALDFNLTLDHRISNTAAIQLGYGLEYDRHEQPLSTSILKNQFNLGVSFTF